MDISRIPHNIEITLQITTGIVILVLQSINLWRSWRNAISIKSNRAEIMGVTDITKDIQQQAHIARQALAKIEKLMAGRPTTPYGRRATDIAPPAEPISEMRPPGRNIWPIGDEPRAQTS